MRAPVRKAAASSAERTEVAGLRDIPKLVVMLTHHDYTVTDARAVFEQCRDTRAAYWGMKEEPLPRDEMKALYARMKALGKTTVLEVVAYTEAECLAGAELAADCGCDILMGTTYSDRVNAFCREHRIRYMPFVGEVAERPSVLRGSIEGMIEEAKAYLEKGVYGIDLLAYRWEGDPSELIRQFVRRVDAPVCIAGSVDRESRLEELRNAGPWGFTIGGAFFDGRFGNTMPEQIETVISRMERTKGGE